MSMVSLQVTEENRSKYVRNAELELAEKCYAHQFTAH